MLDWERRHDFLRREAAEDLAAGPAVRPAFLAFAGHVPLLLAFLRDFPPGGHLEAVAEVALFARMLGSDRLALSLAGRAWSLADPVTPVLPGEADLRQRVLVVEEIDAGAGCPRYRSTAHPFDVDAGGRVAWGSPISQDSPSGPVGRLLHETVSHRRRG
ncbi:MAG: hypothetical protein M3276_09895, partial [Actinomycetota bacterium]|nr:hypothetical protein [Actinomycetota bacterium]